MNLVFCADQKMLGALHVAARSVLDTLGDRGERVAIHLFSSDLSETDVGILCKTLDAADKPYSLELHVIDASQFAGFPDLQASFATYFRLVVPEVLDVHRFLYLDADILCRINLLPLYETDLGGHPIGLVAEAPIQGSPDPDVARLLGERASGHYFNAGVMLVDAKAWRSSRLTQRCLEFVGQYQPKYHDQSALNFVLHGDIQCLPECYNCRTNARENWPALIPPLSGQGRLLHFVDSPKPWSPLGRWIHPMGDLWWRFYRMTEHVRCIDHSRGDTTRLKLGMLDPRHRKMIKDRLLFGCYSSNILKNVKGVPHA